MVKILVIGDFHGKFPVKFKKIVKDEKISLIVALGDYPPFHYRKLWFKHCYGKENKLWEFIGKKKYKELVMEDLRQAEIPLKELNKLEVPVYSVLGNIDYPSPDDIMDNEKKIEKNLPNWDRNDALIKRMKKYKNIERFDYKALRFGEYVFIGMRGHSNPGDVKSKNFGKHLNKLKKLFKKFSKENKEGKVIFISHIVPYNTKVDKISMHAHKLVRGKHYGSKLARKIIEQCKPVLAIGGHIHEASGKDKIKKTIIINPGSAYEERGVILELGNKAPNVRFVK